MVHVVLGALFRAGFAHLRAQAAKSGGQFTSPRDVAGCKATELSAINIQPDATRHTGNILLLQTGDGAVVAGSGAGMASVYA